MPRRKSAQNEISLISPRYVTSELRVMRVISRGSGTGPGQDCLICQQDRAQRAPIAYRELWNVGELITREIMQTQSQGPRRWASRLRRNRRAFSKKGNRRKLVGESRRRDRTVRDNRQYSGGARNRGNKSALGYNANGRQRRGARPSLRMGSPLISVISSFSSIVLEATVSAGERGSYFAFGCE